MSRPPAARDGARRWPRAEDAIASLPDGTQTAAGPRRRPWGKAVLAAVLGVVLGLVLAELMVRGYAWSGNETGRRLASRDPLGAVYQPYGHFGYRQAPGRIEGFPNGTRAFHNSLGYRGPLVSLDKPAGTYRIILLGGSTTAGYGVNDGETIDAHMRRLLDGRAAGTCFEVVNLALGGYDSYQDYERMRVDGVRFAPDLVIINSGINDVRNAKHGRLTTSPPDPRTLLWESAMEQMREDARRGGPGPWTLALHYSYLARLPGFALERLGQRRELGQIRAADPDPSAVDYFEINVVRTLDLAFGAGAAVVLSTPPSALPVRNKPSDPPEKSYWLRDAGTTEEYRERLAARQRSIAERLQAAGREVAYVSHRLPLDQFIDDAHLTGAGNLTLARNFIEVAGRFMPPPAPGAAVAGASCAGRRT